MAQADPDKENAIAEENDPFFQKQLSQINQEETHDYQFSDDDNDDNNENNNDYDNDEIGWGGSELVDNTDNPQFNPIPMNRPAQPASDYDAPYSTPKPDSGDMEKREKCFICSQCDAINNINETILERNYRCVNDCFSFMNHLQNLAIVYSANWDTEPTGNQLPQQNDQPLSTEVTDLPEPFATNGSYQVWTCAQCEHVNWFQWSFCAMDHCKAQYNADIHGGYTDDVRMPTNPLREIQSIFLQEDLQDQQDRQIQQQQRQRWMNQNNNDNNNGNNNNNIDHNDDHFQPRGKKIGAVPAIGYEYPSSSNYSNTSYRLLRKFGYAYTNRYHKIYEESYQNYKEWGHITTVLQIKDLKSSWNNEDDMKNNNDNNNNEFDPTKLSLKGSKNIALNSESGDFACVFFDDDNCIPYLTVLKCNDACEFELVCSLNIRSAFAMTIDTKVRNVRKNTLDSVIRDNISLLRVRFIGSNIYVFCFIDKGKRQRVIYHYKMIEQVLDNNDDNSDNRVLKTYEIVEFSEYFDPYFNETQVMDIAIGSNPDIIAILLGKWVGFYTFDPNSKDKTKFQWFHAVQFSQHATDSHAFEFISNDHCSLTIPDLQNEFNENNNNNNNDDDWVINNEYQEVSQKIDEMHSMHNIKETHKSVLDSFANVDMKTDANDSGDWHYGKLNLRNKDCDFDFKHGRFQRFSNRFYCYINCNNAIIAIHPSNPEYQYIPCVNNVGSNQSIFAVSKIFGTFYCDSNRKCIYQSVDNSGFNPKAAGKCVDLTFGNEIVSHLSYDESYGVSGRLMIVLTVENSIVSEMKHVLNRNDFDPLIDMIKNGRYNLDHCKIAIITYQLLFGNELVQKMIYPILKRIVQDSEGIVGHDIQAIFEMSGAIKELNIPNDVIEPGQAIDGRVISASVWKANEGDLNENENENE